MSRRNNKNSRYEIKELIDYIDLTDLEKREKVFEKLTDLDFDSVGRHDFKKELGKDKANNFIFSFNTKKQVLGNCQRFELFVKEEFGINKVNNFTSSHVVAFLEKLKSEGKSEDTLKSYKNSISKLSKAYQMKYNRSSNFYDSSVKDFKIENLEARGRISSDSDIVRLANALPNTDLGNACRFMLMTGCRVGDLKQFTSENFSFNDMKTVFVSRHGLISGENTIDYFSKGGKRVFNPILSENLEWLKTFVESKAKNEKLFQTLQGSDKEIRNKLSYFLTIQSKQILGYKMSRNHEFRKAFANSLWHSEDLKDFSEEEKINTVLGLYLGHGKDRKDLVKNYIVLENAS